LLFPTVCDGFGLVQVEALAEGIPVIATDHAGEVVRDGIDGYVVPAGDVEAICDRLGRLVDDDDLRRAMSRSAQERMKEFTIEAYGRRLMETLRHATQATSSRNRWTTSFC
jgi:glycosyltransferase involved in cell wall biosynthesis